MNLLSTLLAALGIYLAIGFIVGLLFAFTGGARRIDPAAKGATFWFRLIIIPGIAIFWPLILYRWVTGTQPPVECTRHRRAAQSR